jgi:hypothetical protein
VGAYALNLAQPTLAPEQAASSRARKAAAEEFLIARVGGFYPPAVISDELYAKAQRLPKGGSSGLF